MPAKLPPMGENLLLSHLGDADVALLKPNLKRVALERGTVLHPPDRTIDHVHFPLSGMVSLLAVMNNGDQIETGIVGREGVVGASIANHGLYAFGQAIVQIAGEAWQLRSDAFLKMFNASEDFRFAVNGFQSVILLQAQQSAACHALHTVEERLCRWLLQSEDVIESATIPLTQEFLSHMLGVRRNSVSLAATSLGERGLIKYSRGNIRILDREGLKTSACECYEAVRARVNRVNAPRGEK